MGIGSDDQSAPFQNTSLVTLSSMPAVFVTIISTVNGLRRTKI